VEAIDSHQNIDYCAEHSIGAGKYPGKALVALNSRKVVRSRDTKVV
jgi:hypothetical protein